MRKATKLPLAVGFGISTADQVREVGAVADGVVVGSAIERLIENNVASPDLPATLEALARELSSGLPSKNRMSMEKLAECRRQIDSVDLKILALLNERTAIVDEIGRIKQTLSLPIYEPKREEQVFDNVTANNHGPLTGGSGEARLRAHHR